MAWFREWLFYMVMITTVSVCSNDVNCTLITINACILICLLDMKHDKE